MMPVGARAGVPYAELIQNWGWRAGVKVIVGACWDEGGFRCA
jgi:hypothetical protein